MGLLRLLNAFIQSGSDSKAAAERYAAAANKLAAATEKYAAAAEGYAPAIEMLVAS